MEGERVLFVCLSTQALDDSDAKKQSELAALIITIREGCGSNENVGKLEERSHRQACLLLI